MKLSQEKQIEILERWANSEDEQLYDVYKSFSEKKLKAFKKCRDIMLDLGGWDMRILTHNIFQFTVGFMYRSKETGKINFYYITKENNATWEVL